MDTVEALHRYRYQVEDTLALSTAYTFHEIVDMVKAGDLIGYQNEGGVLLCEPVKMTLGWMLVIFMGAGEHDAVMRLVEQAESDAKRAGATWISAIGRPGWIKDARKRGYRVETVTYMKEL